MPESERVTSAYFNDAVFIGDSLTTGIQLYNILPDTTVLAAVGVGLENIYTQEVIGTEDSKQTILEAADAQQPAKIYVMLGINGLKGLGADKTVELYRDLVQHLKETHPDSIIYVQSFMPINEQKFEANYGYNLTNAEIDECNEKLMAMAGEEQVYYVDVASAIKDEPAACRQSLPPMVCTSRVNTTISGLIISRNTLCRKPDLTAQLR